MPDAAPYRSLIEEVRRSEPIASAEFITRIGLVLLASLVGWLWIDVTELPYWAASYFAAIAVEKLLLALYPREGSLAFLLVIVLISGVISSIFTWLPVFLWQMGEPITRYGAMVLLVGGTLNVFLLRTKTWPVLMAYLLPVGGAFFWIAQDFSTTQATLAEYGTAMLLATAIAIYFGISVIEARKTNSYVQRTQAQLAQTQKIDAVGTLIGGISSEFDTMLHTVQGNLELLRINPSRTERQEYIQEALDATRRGAGLVAQLNAYSRRSSLAPVRVNPIEMVQGFDEIARHMLPPTIRFRTQVPSTMDDIFVDASALQSALLNLVLNARDGIKGSGIITMETYTTTSERQISQSGQALSYVVFEVSDTGSGIAADLLPKIFDPFFSTKPERSGTGLGLATVQGFAQHCGGDVRVESQVGRGTHVFLRLPV